MASLHGCSLLSGKLTVLEKGWEVYSQSVVVSVQERSQLPLHDPGRGTLSLSHGYGS